MRFLIAAVLCLLLSARAGFARDGATDISGVDAAAVGAYMPPPEYPRAARAGRVTGTGIIRLRVHISSGLVTRADIEKVMRSEFHWADLHVMLSLDGAIAEMQ